MKKLWLHSVRVYLKVALFFYYKRIKVVKTSEVPKNEPLMFLGNHQNALLDALLIATSTTRFCYFLTRASVFQNKMITKVLKSLRLIPVFRIRDGWANLSNNTDIFKTCSELLQKHEALALFPEGNHNLKRHVRPLSKGFTRIIFEVLERFPELDLKLIPIGVNYQNATAFADEAAIYFGEPFEAKTVISENRNQSVIDLKTKVQRELEKLTTHIPAENYDAILFHLREHEASFVHPDPVNAFVLNSKETLQIKKRSRDFFLKPLFKFILKILLIGPYLIWRFLVKPRVASPEFIGTFRFAIGISLVPLWIISVVILLTVFYNFLAGILFLLLVLLVDLLSVKS